MKILIAADMEGMPGVVQWDQVESDKPDYPHFRDIMTEVVNAAIRGAAEAGVNEFIVADGHASASNLLIGKLDVRAQLNSGTPSPLSMVQGAAEGVNGAMFVGYHARAGTLNAILDHTWSGRILNVWLNGQVVGEIGLNAAVCGHYHVPVVLVSGDQSACAEAMDLLGAIEVAVVKRATGRMAAECLALPEALDKVCEAAARAARRLAAGEAFGYFSPVPPIQLGVEFNTSEMADNACLVPGVIRLEGRRVEIEAGDMVTAYRAFRAMAALARG